MNATSWRTISRILSSSTIIAILYHPGMTYAWTDDMGTISPVPALEAQYRAGIIAATTALETLTKAGQTPIFSRGIFSSPKNAPAHEIAAGVYTAIGSIPGMPTDNSTRARILTLAVRTAELVQANGFGDKGWQALKDAVAARKKASAAPARQAG